MGDFMIKKRNIVFLVVLTLLSIARPVIPHAQQDVFDEKINIVAVKRFISSRGNIKKESVYVKGMAEKQHSQPEKHIPDNVSKKLSLYETYENIIKICASSVSATILSTQAFTDLDFVREDGNDIISIFTKLIGTKTRSGEVAVFLTTLYPTTDIEILKTRQKFIKILESNPLLLQEMVKIIGNIKKIEDNLYSAFFENINDTELRVMKSMFSSVNNNPNLWNLFSIFSLIMTGNYLIFDLFARSYYLYATNFDFSDRTFLNQYALGSLIGSTINKFIALNKLSLVYKLLINSIKKGQEKLISLAIVLSEVEKLYNSLKENNLLTDEFKKAIPALDSLEKFINDRELKTIKNLLRKNTFKGQASVLSNWGNTAVAIQALTQDIRKKFVPLVSVFGSIDMYSAIAKLITRQNVENKKEFCYAEYVEHSKNPVLELEKVWNPLVLTHKSIENIITNDVNFDNNMHLMMVTGPNTCGKTIITTSYVVAALFAQTLGIVPAASCAITPFDSLYVLLTIRSDGSVGDSRFNAEIREMKMLIDSLEKLQKEGKFALVLVDEPFTGTNTQDGEKTAVRLVEKIHASKCLENILMMIATHYHKLTNLTEIHKNIVNYQVQAQRNVDGTLTRFFKLVPGISYLSVVEDLLAKTGF